jgi:hypothetical protein
MEAEVRGARPDGLTTRCNGLAMNPGGVDNLLVAGH